MWLREDKLKEKTAHFRLPSASQKRACLSFLILGMRVRTNRSVNEVSIDPFADTAAILISIVSNSYYGMPRGQINMYLPPEHPIMSLETIEIKMAAVSAKRTMSVSIEQPRLQPGTEYRASREAIY